MVVCSSSIKMADLDISARQTLSLTDSGEMTTLGVGDEGTAFCPVCCEGGVLLFDFELPKRKLPVLDEVELLDCCDLTSTSEVCEEEGVAFGEPLLLPLALDATLFGLDLFMAELFTLPPVELLFEEDELLLSLSFRPERDFVTPMSILTPMF